jgi:hypothetical protein
MALSMIGMVFAAAGYLPPVAGAVLQEAIDVLAVVNALRVAVPPGRLSDYSPPRREGDETLQDADARQECRP